MAAVGSIITNMGALESLNALSLNNTAIAGSEAELSSGLSINSPADNPAGSIEATGFTSQINGQDQAISDTNQTVSMLQTAEGGISQQTNIAQKLYSLAVEAANGTETSQERSSLQAVAEQLLTEMSSISQTTQYNGINLLDGSVSGMSVKTGASSTDNQLLSIPSTSIEDLGTSSGYNTDRVVYNWDGFSKKPFGSGTMYVVGANGVKSGPINVSQTSAAGSLAKQINAYSSTTGVIAKGTNTMTFKFENPSTSSNNHLVAGIHVLKPGSGSGGNPVAYPTGFVCNASSASQLANQIKSFFATSSHPLSAVVDSKYQITITQPSGLNFAIDGGMSNGAKFVSSSGKAQNIDYSITEIAGRLSLSGGSFTLVNGSLVSSSLTVGQHGNPLSKINLSTASGAESAIGVITSAIKQLGAIGGNIGAMQDGIEADTSNLTQAAMNGQTALGVVQDANIPAVTNSLTEEQIAAQAGVAALKESSQLQQSFTSLLP